MAIALKNHVKAPLVFDSCTCTAAYNYTFSGEASGTTLELEELPAGTELQKVDVINDALGAGVTLSIGEKYASTADGTTSVNSLKTATEASSAGVFSANMHPKLFATKRTLTLTTGGGAATGKVSVIVQYVFIGNGE